MPLIDEMNVKDHDAAIRALFGSYEGYRNSPILKEVNGRIVYLEKIKELLPAALKSEHEATPWWDLWSKTAYHVVKRAFMPSFNRKVDGFILRYKNMRALPMKFFVNELNADVDKFCKEYQGILKHINVERYKHED